LKDFFGSRDYSVSIAQPVSKGVAVSGSNTPAKILIQLPDNGRGWYLLKPHDYPVELRVGPYLKIFDKKSRVQFHGSRGDRDYIVVFEKPKPANSNSSGGGGGAGDNAGDKNKGNKRCNSHTDHFR